MFPLRRVVGASRLPSKPWTPTGVAYAFSREQQLFFEVRVLQMLGATALGGAVSAGYAFGM